ncbi:MAG TPA: hypothetical protein VHX65_00340 [Pirellulales bacterium]|jgi:hypothetical protein|nr:hypothetical protein [Pirellulales bacterium]
MPRIDANRFDRAGRNGDSPPDDDSPPQGDGSQQSQPPHNVPEQYDPQQDAATKRKIVFWIALGIVAWGVVLALGDFMVNRDQRRTLIILASVVVFVGFWFTMLRSRRSFDRPRRRRD